MHNLTVSPPSREGSVSQHRKREGFYAFYLPPTGGAEKGHVLSKNTLRHAPEQPCFVLPLERRWSARRVWALLRSVGGLQSVRDNLHVGNAFGSEFRLSTRLGPPDPTFGVAWRKLTVYVGCINLEATFTCRGHDTWLSLCGRVAKLLNGAGYSPRDVDMLTLDRYLRAAQRRLYAPAQLLEVLASKGEGDDFDLESYPHPSTQEAQ